MTSPQRLNKRWLSGSRSPEADLALPAYPPIFRYILYNRGYSTPEQARRFLEARTPAGTDPFGMLGIPVAADRICRAIQRQEKIAVYGDYDADGVTATALLSQALAALGGDVIGYIPNRFDEGYGLNNEALDNLHNQGIRLVITVDCGIRSLEEASHARRLGLDLIITDHHHPSPELPEAVAIVNPKQPDDSYPEKDLAGVGLAHKLASALVARLGDGRLQDQDTLDLVALGTVADLAPLKGENRALVRAGLETVRRPHRQGIMSLIGVAGLQPQRVTADIGFRLRLNALALNRPGGPRLLTRTSPECCCPGGSSTTRTAKAPAHYPRDPDPAEETPWQETEALPSSPATSFNPGVEAYAPGSWTHTPVHRRSSLC
jgi:single-stranded-DNA-specific exonuclease